MAKIVYVGASPKRMMANGKVAVRNEPVEVEDWFADLICDGAQGFERAPDIRKAPDEKE